jgi:class 3 adenylate cyclase
MGKGNEALVYLEQMKMINDSLYAAESGKKLQQMEFAKQLLDDSIATAGKERTVQAVHEKEVQQEKKTRNWSIAGGTLGLLLAVGFYSRWRYVKKSRAALQVEKDRSEDLLLKILPEDIANELKEKGRSDARDFEMVSILFSDFKGFTQISEKLSAVELLTEIGRCFEAFDGIMEKYGIEKIKTIGDAYMAAGGLPIPTENAVKNTVLAGLEMQEFISKRKEVLDLEGKHGFEMRVGIHTGPVVAGIVGVKKFQYDIWGDTVNTASRLESSGEVGKVNVSETIFNALRNDPEFLFHSRGKLAAKGKGEIEMYFVSKTAYQ